MEMAELAGIRSAIDEKIKAYISNRTDVYREPYARASVGVPRQQVFIGTTNADSYLNDPTGNRRFWPVKVGTIDLDALTRDRDQLWAEAVARFDAGEAWWPHGDAAEVADLADDHRGGVVRARSGRCDRTGAGPGTLRRRDPRSRTWQIGEGLPVRPFNEALTGAFAQHARADWWDLAVLAAWGVVGAGVAVRRFRWDPRPE